MPRFLLRYCILRQNGGIRGVQHRMLAAGREVVEELGLAIDFRPTPDLCVLPCLWRAVRLIRALGNREVVAHRGGGTGHEEGEACQPRCV